MDREAAIKRIEQIATRLRKSHERLTVILDEARQKPEPQTIQPKVIVNGKA
jgi:hypothetical protein